MKKVVVLYIFVVIIIIPPIIRADTNKLSASTSCNIKNNYEEAILLVGKEFEVNYIIAPKNITSMNTIVNIRYEIPDGLDLVDIYANDYAIKQIDNNEYVLKKTIEMSENEYKKNSIEFNMTFKADKPGIYDLSDNIECSIDGLNNEKLSRSFESLEVIIEDDISTIEILDMGLILNDNISTEKGKMDLVADEKYNFGVKFNSDNINDMNTTIDFLKDIEVKTFKLYRLKKDKKELVDNGNVENNIIRPEVKEGADSNLYLLIYEFIGKNIGDDFEIKTVFNEDTFKEESKGIFVNFVNWPDLN